MSDYCFNIKETGTLVEGKWPQWSRKVRAALRANGTWIYIEGTASTQPMSYTDLKDWNIANDCIVSVLYCAITALDGYPSHLDNIHYIRSVTLIYALLPSMDHAITSILDTPYIRLLLPADIFLSPSRATSLAHL